MSSIIEAIRKERPMTAHVAQILAVCNPNAIRHANPNDLQVESALSYLTIAAEAVLNAFNPKDMIYQGGLKEALELTLVKVLHGFHQGHVDEKSIRRAIEIVGSINGSYIERGWVAPTWQKSDPFEDIRLSGSAE